MNVKHNINYFKKSDTMRLVGLGLLVTGLISLWLGWSYSYILFVYSTVALPIGIIMFILGSSGRASDEDIEHFTSRVGDGLEVDLTEDKKYAKRVRKIPSPEYAEGYEYLDGLMYTKAKNGAVRSSEYTKAIIYFLTDGLYIVSRTASLVAEEVRNSTIEISYAQLEAAEILRESKYMSYNKNSYRVNNVRLVIKYDGGNSFSCPINDDIDADKLVQTVMDAVAEYKKANADA